MPLDANALEKRHRDLLREAREISKKLDACEDAGELRKLETKFSQLMLEADEVRYDLEDAWADQLDNSVDLTKRPGQTPRASRGGLVTESGEPVATLTREQRFADWVQERGEGREYADLSLGRYFRAMVLGAKTDLEKRALSEGSDSAGGYTVPDILSSRLIDLMRNRLVVNRAGAMTMPLTSDQHYIAKVASDAVPAWRSEAGTVAESDPTFDRVSLVPRSLAVLTKISRELWEDSVNLAQALPNMLAGAMAVELDRVALFGSGTAPEPRGIVNTTNVEEVAHNAALTSYAPLVSARTKLTSNNFSGDDVVYIMHPEMEGELIGLVDGNSQPLLPPPAIGRLPLLTTGNVPAESTVSPEDGSIIAGVFRHLIVGIRNEVRVEILRERYADTMEYGLLAYLRADVAVEHPGAFCKITGVRTS